MDLITIIVPAYNVEHYISKCLESISAQTYKNIEVLIVNDGSTDATQAVIDEWVRRDQRFKKILKVNGGLSSARNLALKYVNGDYIAFIDSDDWLDVKFIQSLYDLIIKFQADIAACDAHMVFENKKNRIIEEKVFFSIFTQEDAIKEYLTDAYKCNEGVCNKIYKKKLWENLEFPNIMAHEDTGTTFKLLSKSQRLVWTSERLYFYLQRQGSITKSGFSDKSMCKLDAINQIGEDISKNYAHLYECYNNRKMGCALELLIKLLISNDLEKYKKHKIYLYETIFELSDYKIKYKKKYYFIVKLISINKNAFELMIKLSKNIIYKLFGY